MACSPAHRLLSLLSASILVTAAVFAGTPPPVLGEAPALPLARITQRIDETSLIPLHGNTHPLAVAKFDMGAAPAIMPANRLLLVLRRSAQQEADLQTYLVSVQNSGSENYRKWLTPEDFGKRFGVSDADLAVVQTWLQGHGFSVNKVAKGRMAIEFSGTAGAVESAFHTSIHRYMINGEQHLANATDPKIPSALEPVVAGLAELSDFTPKALAKRGPGGRYNPKTHRIEPTYTTGDSSSGYYIFLGPADAATIYDTPTSLNATPPGKLFDGTGVTIGIAGDSNIDVTQNANYRATFGLSAKATAVVVDGADPGENGDAIEAYLDTEVSGGIAPNANVILYTAADTELDAGLFLAIGRALDDNQVDILNVSFGGCEASQGASGNQFLYDLWEQAAAQGISVTVSTGDNGSAGCDNPDTETAAQDGLAVNGLASTPYNIAVGGTDFDVLLSDFPSSFTQYVDINNTLPNHRSALGYIPEEPWNNSTMSNTTLSVNAPLTSYLNIVGGGGGVSSCATQTATACVSGYATPSWQSGFATDTSGRNLPDVSFLAANGFYGALWGLCTDLDSDQSGNPVTDCAGNPTSGNDFNLTGVGGTSASAPAFAGILALVKQKVGARLGQADYVLYDLAKSNYSTVFHDVATGNNSVACTAGSPDCVQNTVGNDYLSGYDTKVGYDEASGLGSVDGNQLVSNWAGVALSATTSSLTLNGGTAAVNITHGAKVTVGTSVTGGGGTPAGDVALVDNINPAQFPNNDSLGFFTLQDGTVNGFVTNLPGGSYSVSAHYGGSSTFAESDSNAIPVKVAPESSSIALQLTGYYDPATGEKASTPYYGFYFVLDAEPYGSSSSASSPNGAATGTVTFLNGSAKLGSSTIGSDGIAELDTNTIPAGNNSLTASFPGDSSFLASTSAPAALSVTPAVTTVSAPVLSTNSAFAGSSVTMQASLSNIDSLGDAPTGTVTFFDQTSAGTTTLGTVNLQGTAGTAYAFAGGSASYTTTLLPVGNDSITAVYNGDANYAASPVSGASSVTVLAGQTTLKMDPAATTIKVNQSLLVAMTLSTVAGLNAPTGTVTITSNGYTSPAAAVASGKVSITIPANTLPLGSDTLIANYSGDTYYSAATGTAVIQVNSIGTLKPIVTVTPGASPNLTYPLLVTATVAGTASEPVPTGTVKLVTASYSFAPLTLVNGTATYSILTGVLPVGTDSLQLSYSGDSNYTSGSATGEVVIGTTPGISVTPAAPTIEVSQTLSVAVAVQGNLLLPTPTGTVTLTSGTYTSAATAISASAATIVIPANSLAVGTDTLTATYSGDKDYNPSSSTATVTVSALPPTFALTNGGNISIAPGATTGNQSLITVTPANGFTGAVTLSAAIASGPAGAVDSPTFSYTGNPVTITASGPGTATIIVATTAATTSSLAPGSLSRPTKGGVPWYPAGGVALASLVLLGIPARHRKFRALVGLFILLGVFAASVVACGGGSSHHGNPGTTPGAYTVTVTGTSGTLTGTTTITVTVN